MTPSQARTGGLAGLVAAAAFVLSAVIYLIAPGAGPIDTPAEYLYRGITVVGFLAVIVTVFGIQRVHAGRERYGLLGTVAVVATIIGYGVFAIVTVLAMVADVEYLMTFRLAGGGVLLLGSALLGITIIRAGLLPRWIGVLLIVAFPLGDVANAVFPVAENFLLALLWASMGYALLARPSRAAAPVAAADGAVRTESR